MPAEYKYKCPVEPEKCGHPGYDTPKKRKDHVEKTHPKFDPNFLDFPCRERQCAEVFIVEKARNTHEKEGHPRGRDSSFPCRYIASGCNHPPFSRDTDRRHHEQTAHGANFEVYSGEAKQPRFVTSTTEYGRIFRCPDCNKPFATGNEVTKHLKSHTGALPYFCAGCKLRFATLKELQVHDDPKPHMCPRCRKRHSAWDPCFFVPPEVIAQIEEADKELTYCYECDRFYVDIRTRQDHEARHASPKFVCTVCNRGLNTWDHLRAHQETQRHQCQRCGGERLPGSKICAGCAASQVPSDG